MGRCRELEAVGTDDLAVLVDFLAFHVLIGELGFETSTGRGGESAAVVVVGRDAAATTTRRRTHISVALGIANIVVLVDTGDLEASLDVDDVLTKLRNSPVLVVEKSVSGMGEGVGIQQLQSKKTCDNPFRRDGLALEEGSLLHVVSDADDWVAGEGLVVEDFLKLQRKSL